MPDLVTIKPITATDALLLSEVALKAYCDHYLHLWYDEGQWYINRCFTEPVLKNELEDPNNLFFLAYLNNEPVGFLKLRLNAPFESAPEKNAMELERIYLNKAVTGKGLGRRLVELSVAIARENQKELLWLKAMDSSTGPIAFYQQMGFALCGTYHLDFTQMKEALRGMVIMKKEL